MIDVKAELIKIVYKYVPKCRIFLFGSRARGTHREGADYDIALDSGTKIPREVMLNIGEDIHESDIYVFVDVVDLNDVSQDFLNVIKKDLVEWTKN